ncbi:hypothetical protein EXE43_02255 [Halorubrum sp. SS5]|nr:hypothetical protein EXE43_02255 [Halorubrum sp. SS5]
MHSWKPRIERLDPEKVRTYEASPAGQALLEVFYPTVETAATLGTLGDPVVWLPFTEVNFDVRHLDNACVVQSAKADATRPVNRSLDLIDQPETVRLVIG